MDFLRGVNTENIMLLNTIYHRPNKAEGKKDCIDIIYKNVTTGDKYLKTIEEPEIEIYFAKPEYRNYDYNKAFLPLDKTNKVTCKYKDVLRAIADDGGDSCKNFIKTCIENRQFGKMKELHKYHYVFGSDYDIENWYRAQYLLKYHHDKPTPLTKVFLDIEVDTIDIDGFPRDGECPVNAVTIIDQLMMRSYTFLLRNDKNPKIKEFESNIKDFKLKLADAFDESYGKIEYRVLMYDDERDLLTDIFALINSLKRDFLLIWNLSFDIPYLIARMERLNMDVVNTMCHKDFKYKEIFFLKDHRNFKIANKGDYFKISSYTTYLDQMIVYAGLII